jgi:hypothetical protein
VLCDDKKLYVVKMHPNPQGNNVLANEVLGSFILSGLGLLVPTWRPLTINLKALPLFPELAMATNRGTRFPACGVHFGSEFLGGPQFDLYDFIPHSYQPRVKNSAQFAAINLFDIWADHQDERQCVYRRNRETGAYEALFLDNGHLFGGPSWSDLGRQPRRAYSPWHQEPKLEHEGIEKCLVLFEQRIPALLHDAVALTPKEWYRDDIHALSARFIERLYCLRRIVQDTRKWKTA